MQVSAASGSLGIEAGLKGVEPAFQRFASFARRRSLALITQARIPLRVRQRRRLRLGVPEEIEQENAAVLVRPVGA